MVFLLDTNAISDLLRDAPKAIAWMSALAPTDQVRTCAIACGEVLFGIARLAPGKRQTDLKAATNILFSTLPCDPIDADAATTYARIKCAAEVSGKTLSENDLWIAAAALQARATLITRDQAFKQVTGLVTLDWTI